MPNSRKPVLLRRYCAIAAAVLSLLAFVIAANLPGEEAQLSSPKQKPIQSTVKAASHLNEYSQRGHTEPKLEPPNLSLPTGLPLPFAPPQAERLQPPLWITSLTSAKQQAVAKAFAEHAGVLRAKLGVDASSKAPDELRQKLELSQADLFRRLVHILDAQEYRQFVASLPNDLQESALKFAK
jgi:hypothetical protein